MQSPNTTALSRGEFFLSKISYLEERREIIAEFSNLSEKKVERFKFFPKAFLNIQGKAGLAKEVLSLYDAKRFKVSALENGICGIQAGTFTDLKKISSLLEQSFRQGLNIAEPERQFLLEKHWNYFDSFKPEKFGMEKTCSAVIPQVKADFCEESLENTLKQLARHDKKTTGFFLEAFALSKELQVPMQAVPENNKAVALLFLENCFFKNSFAMQKNASINNQAFEEGASGFFENVSEIDFSQVWAWLFSSKQYNLGFETINCKCCKPEGFTAGNVLPDSRLEVKFLQNGFYYNSESQDFALEFHNSKDNKKARLQRMKEWFLKSIPTGPFNTGEKCLVPLNDALLLEQSGKAKISGNEMLNWFCEKKESFMAREIQMLILKITQCEDKLLLLEHNALTAHKVLCSFQLSETPEYLTAYYEKQALERLLKAVLKELNNSSSAFYSEKLAQALKAVQCQKIAQFKQIAKTTGEKILQASPETILIQAENPLVLVKEFAKKAKTPMPAIRQNFKELVLS